MALRRGKLPLWHGHGLGLMGFRVQYLGLEIASTRNVLTPQKGCSIAVATQTLLSRASRVAAASVLTMSAMTVIVVVFTGGGGGGRGRGRGRGRRGRGRSGGRGS